MTNPLIPQAEYEVRWRRISGTRAEKLEQIDAAIQELLDIKTLECAFVKPGVQFLAVPRARRHSLAMTVVVLALLIVLVLLVGVHTSRAQDGGAAPAPAAETPAPVAAAPAPEKKPDPFAFADFTWLSGNSRTKESPLDSKVFTGEFRVDTNYTYSFNNPSDDTISGSSEIFRSGEFQLTQLGVGGDLHYDNVQARLMTQLGMYAQTTPRNDASPGRGQWDLHTAYRYVSEAYGGYHLDKMNGINLQAGIFMSYIGLWSPVTGWMKQTVIPMAVGLAVASPQVALARPPAQGTAAPAPPLWHAVGTFDVSFLNSNNDPENHLFRTRGTTPKLDEPAVDMAMVGLKKASVAESRWGVELTAQGGHDTDTFGFSPTAPNIAGAEWLRRLGPTDVSYLAPVGKGLTVQGGMFSSLIGYDSLFAKDNFTYTRPWGADFTPYYMLGGNVAYPFTDTFTLTGFVVNSYFHLSQPNHVPSVGAQLAFAPAPQLSVKETLLWGSHQKDTSLGYWRFLSDTIVERKWPRATVAGELQVATETVAQTGEQASWVSAQMPIHIPIGGPWSVTVRPEVARDPSGRYTSVSQTVYAMTSTLEYKHHFLDADAILRAEYRFDNSQGAGGGFFSGPANDLVPHQDLLIGAFILAIDHGVKVSK